MSPQPVERVRGGEKKRTRYRRDATAREMKSIDTSLNDVSAKTREHTLPFWLYLVPYSPMTESSRRRHGDPTRIAKKRGKNRSDPRDKEKNRENTMLSLATNKGGARYSPGPGPEAAPSFLLPTRVLLFPSTLAFSRSSFAFIDREYTRSAAEFFRVGVAASPLGLTVHAC